MKKLRYFFGITAWVLFSCADDEGRTCTNCRSDQTANFELCREGNGNASVNGEDTNTPYDTYVDNLRETGVICGGS